MDLYAVFGNPISQSKSPFIHTLFARQTQQQLSYTAIEPAEDGFADALAKFWQEGGKGCNVTAPFKEQAFQAAQQHTERALLAGAVNTLKLTDDGIILGDNTDGAGLVADLIANFGELKDLRVLLLGAGGAARGVIRPLLDEQISELVIVNRTVAKAEALAERFSEFGKVSSSSFEDLSGQFDIIINSTSAGLKGQLPPLKAQLIQATTRCYDMTYSADVTAFNAWAAEQGAAKVVDGLGMLVGQAAESFTVWRGIRPGFRQVLRELRRNLSR
ncbi:shikimate dehydrogenase [Agarivorans sp. B2Z047]|uniref:shikimate dehydrogenase n=1 Tax=Agarivorans sp. B2Z047 TaxID=2652721 RepID=UPI00128C76CD|nr:shikimate dehydrogenase [Agarivorans sp. B2Z047]MPW31382.1 shikimate dehydrogenase [Agarivorans sp. B2Z047]UQN42656.1 shikimate dehydrogenase [Agarivorans sp. B2Z047]